MKKNLKIHLSKRIVCLMKFNKFVFQKQLQEMKKKDCASYCIISAKKLTKVAFLISNYCIEHY